MAKGAKRKRRAVAKRRRVEGARATDDADGGKARTATASRPRGGALAQHYALELVETNAAGNRTALRHVALDPLDLYHRRMMLAAPANARPERISAAEWENIRFFQNGVRHAAGTKLREDHTIGMVGVVTSRYEVRIAGGGQESDGQLQARDRLHRALTAAGDIGGALARDVCCLGYQISACEQARGWKTGFGLFRLREALDDVALAYGLARRAELRVLG